MHLIIIYKWGLSDDIRSSSGHTISYDTMNSDYVFR